MGLLRLSQGLFLQADVQLCTMHMWRNSKTHFSKEANDEFQQGRPTVKTAWSEQVGKAQFDDLCECFVKGYPSWSGKLCKKHTHYPAFLKYPERRWPFSTTN